ncbi:MAG: NAD(P)H-hydrate dehydratase [Planctomycetota bacterium]|nr:NAD(P)H-hydrate dehydratase [Planctomycetota bacterium]
MPAENNSLGLPELPSRASHAHKGAVGRVLVIAGSPGMSGAAFLCARAALLSGAGIVTIACPESIHDALEIKTTCIMTKGIPAREGVFGPWSAESLNELVGSYDALAIGPGVGAHPATQHFFARWIPEQSQRHPCVIDADALNALAKDSEAQQKLSESVVLTPHPGELGRWLSLSTAEIQRDRARVAGEFSQCSRTTLLLKGEKTLVARKGDLYENTTGNPGMATAGSGDVLTGVIASFLAAGSCPWDSSRLGAYIHGAAGDIAEKKRGALSMTAMDILSALSESIRQFQSRVGT